MRLILGLCLIGIGLLLYLQHWLKWERVTRLEALRRIARQDKHDEAVTTRRQQRQLTARGIHIWTNY